MLRVSRVVSRVRAYFTRSLIRDYFAARPLTESARQCGSSAAKGGGIVAKRGGSINKCGGAG